MKASAESDQSNGNHWRLDQHVFETEVPERKQEYGELKTDTGPETGRQRSGSWNRKRKAAPNEAQRELIFG